MINVNIVHEGPKSYIADIYEQTGISKVILSTFSNFTGKTDLSCLNDKEGEQIQVNHFTVDDYGNKILNYSIPAKLTFVGEKNGLRCIEYEKINDVKEN